MSNNNIFEGRNILVHTDGSDKSEAVVEFICSIQKVIDAKINIVYVIEVPRNLPISRPPADLVDNAKSAIERAKIIAQKYKSKVDTSIIYARFTEDAIINTSEDLKCDIIALAQEGQRLRIFSNMSFNISQRAKCSVWLFNNK